MARCIYLAGVDEAGRGPLAGPVAVGVVVVPQSFDWTLIPGVGDSKQVSAKNREAVFRRAQALRRSGIIDFTVSLIHAATIDKIGITESVRRGIVQGFIRLQLEPKNTEVRLDGLLHAPASFKLQSTIIKGDAKEKCIGLASILAKVTRDQYMVKMGKKYPCYGFEVHKGYGTKAHERAIHEHGLSVIHRKSFCKKFSLERAGTQ